MIRLYATDLDRYVVPDGVLSDHEEARALRKVSAMLRQRQRASFAFVRLVLARHLGIPPRDVPVGVAEGGKPWTTSVQFNLSHSDERALLAVADIAVGVDIEAPILRTRPELAREILSERELAAWSDLPEGDARIASLTRTWVRKEAVLKAHGGGLRQAPASLEIVESGPAVSAVTADGQAWRLLDLALAEGWAAAVAWPEAAGVMPVASPEFIAVDDAG